MAEQDTLMTKFSSFVLNQKWLVIVLSILLIVAAAMGAKNLVFNPDNRAFFHEDNPQLVAFENMENTYSGRDENVLIVLGPKDGNVFTRDTLAVVEKYTNEAWQIPFSTRVNSITNFQNSYAEEDDVIIEDLVKNAESLTNADLARIRDVAMKEPLLYKLLISEQGHTTGINVTIKMPGDDLSEEHNVVAYARDMVKRIKAENPDMEVHLTGLVMLNTAFSEASENDSKTLMMGTLIMFIIAVGILMKGWTAAFTVLWIVIFSSLGALGAAGWLGVELTAVSASAPTIITTLAIANAVHVLVSFVEFMRSGMDKQSAMAESLRINFQPITLVSVTTILGFLTMNFSESPPFHALGNIISMGVGFSYFLAFTFLPAMMMVLPVKAPEAYTENRGNMVKLADFVIGNQNKLLWGGLGVFIVIASFLPRNQLNDEWIKYFGESMDFRTSTDYMSENLTGFYRIDYSLPADGPNGISDPQYLQNLENFIAWYREQPEVVQVTGLTDIVTRLNKNMHSDEQSYHRIPDNREEAAQYILLYEMSVPYGLDLNNIVDMEKSSSRVTATTHDITVQETLALEARAQAWLEEKAPSMAGPGTGNSIMFAHIGMNNIIGTLSGTAFALILISIILIVAFRSFKIGAISLIPNLMPSLMGFGVWGLFVGEIGMGLATVAGVTMGIVVDDTVHFLSKYLRARREQNLPPEEAVRYAFSTVGKALWFTSFALVAGFSVLAFSVFRMNGDMALLTAVTIAIALIADFLFLPPLLMKLDRVRDKLSAGDTSGADSLAGAEPKQSQA